MQLALAALRDAALRLIPAREGHEYSKVTDVEDPAEAEAAQLVARLDRSLFRDTKGVSSPYDRS
jgi:hypothetical protein